MSAFGLRSTGVSSGPGEDSRRRDVSAEFEALATSQFDSLYNLARWLTNNRHDAEDFVQETLLKALKAFPSFEPGTNFRAWIFRILRNTILSSRARLDWRMTIAMESEEDLPVQAVVVRTPETVMLERSDTDAVRKAIEQLPINYREVLLLCDVEETSYREISEILSIPIGTVMSRLARARKGLRRAFNHPSEEAETVKQPTIWRLQEK